MFFLGLWASRLFYDVFEKNKNNDRMAVLGFRFDKDFLRHLAKPKTIIAVTGTNGKTTTCNMLRDLFLANGYKVTSNHEGLNMRSGITKAFARDVTWFNKPKTDVAIIEFDEISTKDFLDQIKPNYVVVTNLTADMISLNGHVDFTYQKINEGLPENATLVLNGDDIISCRLGKETNRKIFFSIAKQPDEKDDEYKLVNDGIICPNCSEHLQYSFHRYHSTGFAKCPNCGFENPKPDYQITEINREDNTFTMNGEKIKMVNNNIINIYNQLVCCVFAKEFKMPKVSEAFENIQIIKTRADREVVNGVEIISQLAKSENPIALDRTLKYICSIEGEKDLLMTLGDPHDIDSDKLSENVAYLYQVDFSILNDPSIRNIILFGYRTDDVKLRMLINGVDASKLTVAKDNDVKIKGGVNKIILMHALSSYYLAMEVKEKVKEQLL